MIGFSDDDISVKMSVIPTASVKLRKKSENLSCKG